MAELVYALCALTGFACALLLARGYVNGGGRLLLWSALCFVGLAVNDALLLAQTLYGPLPLGTLRALSGLLGVSGLLYGLIFDAD
jgi:hypothetical protein